VNDEEDARLANAANDSYLKEVDGGLSSNAAEDVLSYMGTETNKFGSSRRQRLSLQDIWKNIEH